MSSSSSEQDQNMSSSSSSTDIGFGLFMSDYMKFLEIPLLDLELATSNFADKNLLSVGSSFKVYKGKLLQLEGFVNIVARGYPNKHIFYNELVTHNMLRHKNIVPIYKIVSAGDARFIIKKHMANGSLEKHLNSPTLTWRQRLHICVRIAHALKYLHYHIENYTDGPDTYIIYGNLKSSKILLDHKWEPKLYDFRYTLESSKMNALCLTEKYNGSLHYRDPEYESTAGLSNKSDVFSFGVVLFEVLFGKEASFQTNDNFQLVPLARSHYEEGTLDDLIDPDLRKQMSLQSLNIFVETAYYCIKDKRSERENMNQVLSKLEEALKLQHKHDDPGAEGSLLSKHLKGKSLDHLRFQLRDIELATNNFSESCCIGSGGYGKVYRAQLNVSEINSWLIEGQNEGKFPRKHSTVAIKRIYSRNDKQGEQGFLAEIEMLSNVKHPNIVSLLGFCDEGEEMILVYEYVSNGSLADYLEKTGQNANFTWAQRIQICIDIAHGLKYLHTSTKDRQSIIHRDIKSDNILLDENWVAKIADFGLSKLHPSNQKRSTLITNNIAGTDVYLDPEYLSTGRLKTKSDVYSFGVVLFEIMCGKLAHDKSYGQKRLPSIARKRFNEGTLNDMIDPKIKETDENILMLIGAVDQDSLETFTKVAYQCLAKTQLERPTMGVVIKELENALNFQITNKNNLQIPLKALKLGTENFNHCNCIGEGRFWKLYKGEVEHANERTNIVAKRWDMKSNQRVIQFSNELYMLSHYKHENIIGLVGYCNEGEENIIVYECASNGILNKHLGDPSLTWMKRLKIAIGVARGLRFLHNDNIDFNSGSILLDGDWNAKISNFEMSGSEGIYENENWERTKKSGIYSLGVILVELLCGRSAWVEGCMDHSQLLGHLDARHIDENRNLDEMIFGSRKEQIWRRYYENFEDIAIQCLRHDKDRRPDANTVVEELEKILQFHELRVPIEPIKLGTQNFSNCIGEGRFWKLYKGKIEHADGCDHPFIAKRWDKNYNQANILFSTEVVNLFKKKNEAGVIGIEGYCDEENEKIIVYEDASNGSLDKHLGDPSLTWMKRLMIAIGVVAGVIRLDGSSVKAGDIRSDSILLDGNWNAKISNVSGYVDLAKQNPDQPPLDLNAYSLGVILIELLCGRLAWAEGCEDYSISLAYQAVAHYHVNKNFNDMIFEGIKEQIHPRILAIYQATAIDCLRGSGKMIDQGLHIFLMELKKAMIFQKDLEAWEPKLPLNYKELIPENFEGNKQELYNKLHEGILFQDGKVFFSIGSNGEGNETISARKFSYKNPSLHKFRSVDGSRFSKVSKMFDSSNLNIHIKIRTLFLCPSANYKVYLIFRFCGSRKSHAKPMYVNLKYKMGNESLCTYFATWREDGWMMVELFQFLCHKKDTDFEVLLESFSRSYCGRHSVYIEGVRFQEIRNVKHEDTDNLKKVQQVTDSESKTTEGKEDTMLRAREVVHNSSQFAIESRFKGAFELLREQVFHIKCKIKSEMLSSNKENACYLVFKLSDKHCGLHGPVVVRDLFHWRKKETKVFYFRPQKPWNLHNTDCVPKERIDGWMEVILWKYNSNYELKNDHLFVNLKLVTYEGTMAGLIVRNIEFR